MASAQQHRELELNPTFETRHGVEVFWQIPEHAKAILFIAHGARGRPSTYWDVHGHEGLPQHKAVTRSGLEKGFAVITIDSVEHCWSRSPVESNPDIANVEKILTELKGENAKLKDLHLTVLGSASGGTFVSALALKLKIFSAVLVIASSSDEALKTASKGSYPPTLFVHLKYDDETNNKVKEDIHALQSKDIPTDEIVAEPVPITPTTFSDNIEGLDAELSHKLQEALLSHNVINEHGFVVKKLHPPEAHQLLQSFNILPEDDSEGRRGFRHGRRGHRQAAEGQEGTEEKEGTEQDKPGPGRGRRGGLAEGEEGRPHRFGPGRRRRGICATGAENEGGEAAADADHEDDDDDEHHTTEVSEEQETAQAGAEHQAGGERGHRHHGAGRHGHGQGHRRGKPLKWEREVKKELFVAEGLYALTSNKSVEIFNWLDGKTWNK
eukprot:TRINITY_DN1044_c0_g1_i2.p1 TRINITY_DN1044_c0_g1~~TRINITY_DN1044_c0_g1_i2.p1  ORF type:complete len:439 (+),score=55.61 TRINITY_DN1044_c0_g1_i2:180-1496(+)